MISEFKDRKQENKGKISDFKITKNFGENDLEARDQKSAFCNFTLRILGI